MIKIAGGVVTPHGFKAAGAHVGLRRKKKDLTIISSDVPAVAAATFTTNVIKGAPIQWNQAVLSQSNKVSAIVVNSGYANSCTGPVGLEHAAAMAATTAECLGLTADQVLVASTGLIGVPLPIEKVQTGIKTVAALLARCDESATAAAEGILTTDSCPKQIATKLTIGGKQVTIGAMAKGSGMVHPNMCTMLAFITTDVAIAPELLQIALRKSVCQTYNMISVDGDTSTNDMVVILANGLAGNEPIAEMNEDYQTFATALDEVNLFLAKQIVSDGEGATKFLEVTVKGTQTQEEAQKLSKSVITSNLVKTAFFGEDANWGRILAALGIGGVKFDPEQVSIEMSSGAGKFPVMNFGKPADVDQAKASSVLKEREIQVMIQVGDGLSAATAFGCDLSYDYVRINGQYRR